MIIYLLMKYELNLTDEIVKFTIRFVYEPENIKFVTFTELKGTL